MRVTRRSILIAMLFLAQCGSAQAQNAAARSNAENAAVETKLIGAWAQKTEPDGDVVVFGADHTMRMNFRCGPRQYKSDKILGDKPLGTWTVRNPQELAVSMGYGEKKTSIDYALEFFPDGSMAMHNKAEPPDGDNDVSIPYHGKLPFNCPAPAKDDEDAWNQAESLNTVSSYKAYLDRYKNGFFAAVAVSKIKKMGG